MATPTALPTPAEIFNLSGRVAAITGGAGHLGGVFARTIAGAGASLALIDRDPVALEKRTSEIRGVGAGAIGIVTDVGDEAQVKRAIEQIKTEYGRLDVLVNNAAAKSPNFFAPVEAFPLDDWNQVLRVNLTGMFLCVRTAESLLLASGKASIINVSSIYGVSAPDQRIYEGVAFNTPAIYSASKSGVVGLTRYLATYYSGRGIRCNALTPGGVFAGQPARFVEQYSARTPLGRMARADEMGPALLYLASDASSYVTGHNLVVDGGWTAW